MDKIITKTEFLKEQKAKIINYKEFLTVAKNYKLSNKKDSLNNLINRLLNGLKSGKISNENIDTLKYLNTIFIKDSKKIEELSKIDNSLYNKKIISNLIDMVLKTQKLGVIAETNGNNIAYKIDLVDRSAWAIMNDFYTQLLSVKLVQQKPGKNKNKK